MEEGLVKSTAFYKKMRELLAIESLNYSATGY